MRACRLTFRHLPSSLGFTWNGPLPAPFSRSVCFQKLIVYTKSVSVYASKKGQINAWMEGLAAELLQLYGSTHGWYRGVPLGGAGIEVRAAASSWIRVLRCDRFLTASRLCIREDAVAAGCCWLSGSQHRVTGRAGRAVEGLWEEALSSRVLLRLPKSLGVSRPNSWLSRR